MVIHHRSHVKCVHIHFDDRVFFDSGGGKASDISEYILPSPLYANNDRVRFIGITQVNEKALPRSHNRKNYFIQIELLSRTGGIYFDSSFMFHVMFHVSVNHVSNI